MDYIAGASYYAEFTTQRFDTGAATNADSLPTATATHNGADDSGFALTVANIATGRYKITGTVPAYSVGDVVQVSVAATVNSVPGVAVVDEFRIVAAIPSVNSIEWAGSTAGPVLFSSTLAATIATNLNAPVGLIPTNPALASSWSSTLAATIATNLNAPVGSIPTNPASALTWSSALANSLTTAAATVATNLNSPTANAATNAQVTAATSAVSAGIVSDSRLTMIPSLNTQGAAVLGFAGNIPTLASTLASVQSTGATTAGFAANLPSIASGVNTAVGYAGNLPSMATGINTAGGYVANLPSMASTLLNISNTGAGASACIAGVGGVVNTISGFTGNLPGMATGINTVVGYTGNISAIGAILTGVCATQGSQATQGALAAVAGQATTIGGFVGNLPSMATTLAGLATSGQVGNLTAPNNAGISATAMVVNAMSTNGVLLSATQSLYAPAKAGDEMTLTVAYDAAKSAASQTSVNALGTPQQAGTKYAVSWNWSDVSGSQPSFVASNMVSLAGIATGVEVAAAQDAITAALGSLSITLSGDEITALAAAIAGDITVTGLTDTQNTWLESAYTHTEYIVNGTPIIILPPFPLPGYGYCSTGDINAYWGQQNVLKWANMNNLDPTSDQGLADIAAFTQNAIVKATAEIDEVMRGGPYLLPLTPQDASTAVSLADVCSRIAGILLHNARGLEDENGAFTACRKDMDARLKEWRNPQIGRRLNCQTASAAAACNVPTTSPRRQRDWRGSIPLPPDSPLIP